MTVKPFQLCNTKSKTPSAPLPIPNLLGEE